MRKAGETQLSRDKEVLRILLTTKTESLPEEPLLGVPQYSDMTLALLRSARGEVVSQAMGTRSVRKSPRLAWDQLIEIFGDEQILRTRIEELKAAQPAADPELMALADRYLSGWRPKRFEDDE